MRMHGKYIRIAIMVAAFAMQHVAKGQAITDYHKLYKKFFREQQCDERAFEYAWRGYEELLTDSLLYNPQYLTIVDYTKYSNQERLFVLDVSKKKLLISSMASHGKGSDKDSVGIPLKFSNKDNSHMTSLGFYITGSIYTNFRKKDSLGLCLFGVDDGYNDAACDREIVIHYGANERTGEVYVTDTSAGRSYGCPALPLSTNSKVIKLISGGSCLFMYSDRDKLYPTRSTVLNGGIKKEIVQHGPPPNNCTCNLKPRNRN